MTIVKAIETKEMKVWIEQHNEFFILKHQERNKEVMALNAIQNLSLILDMFETLVGKKLMSN
jgi:hypothetical protein